MALNMSKQPVHGSLEQSLPYNDNWEVKRNKLVGELKNDSQLSDAKVLNSIGQVPRHLFVPKAVLSRAYEDNALPIGKGQSISQPFVVAYMIQALGLKSTDRVLEIGAGSGYNAAVMSLIVEEVFTVEIVPELGKTAASLLEGLGYANIHVRIGDGYRGWQEEAPFDAVILTAAPEEIPQPLIDQLANGGRLIAPVGERMQKLVLIEKNKQEKISQRNLIPVVFVPMTGEAEK